MTFRRQQDSFTRPDNATQYGAGDLVANSATAGEVVPLSFNTPSNKSCIVRAASLSHSDEDATASTFRIWLLSVSPTVTNGDNGALAGVDAATVLGTIEITADENCGDTYGMAQPAPILVSGPFYGLVEATGTYTPAAEETFIINLTLEEVG